KTVHIITILFLSTMFSVDAQKCFSQKQQPSEKVERNSSDKTKQDEIEGIVLSGVSTNIEEFFITEPIKILEFQIQNLEISATNTIPIGETIKIKTKSGFFIGYQISTNSFFEKSIDVKLTPFIVEDKGIEIKINVSHEGKTLKEETVFTRNFESLVVELMEKDDEYKKLANKITPVIHVIKPPVMFPWHIERVEMKNYILFVETQGKTNTTFSNRSLSAETSDGQIFMHFFQRGMGVFVVSFAPFEGAQPNGVVSDNIIRIKQDNIYLEWISRKPILPEGKWLVWVRSNSQYDPGGNTKFSSGIATSDIVLRRFFK
ncbi:hypothetical protein ACFLQZ_05145, partial [Acidobacteriota bacterium]